jgi:hypothetical protein
MLEARLFIVFLLEESITIVEILQGKFCGIYKMMVIPTMANGEPSASCHGERSAAISRQARELLTLRVRFAVAAGACRERSGAGGSQ